MPNRLLISLVPQRILNSVAAALLLASVPVLSSAVADNPPTAAIALNDSSAAAELASQFPLVVTFTDRMGTAEFAQLPTALDIDGAAQMSGYRAGDIAYLASEQSVVVFLSDGKAVPDGGLVLIGHVTTGLDSVAGCVRSCDIQLEGHAGVADLDED